MSDGTSILPADDLIYGKKEPLYWIPVTVEAGLSGYKANNDDSHYRWCSYDDDGKEYVEWDSANVAMNIPVSSVPSVGRPQWDLIAYNQVAAILDQLNQEQILYILKHEMMYHLRDLRTKRSLKLLHQLERFDPKAALELSE